MQKIEDWFGKTKEILITSDHGGLQVKEFISKEVTKMEYQVIDIGPYKNDPEDDYPDYAGKLGLEISTGKAKCGILVCRSGLVCL